MHLTLAFRVKYRHRLAFAVNTGFSGSTLFASMVFSYTCTDLSTEVNILIYIDTRNGDVCNFRRERVENIVSKGYDVI